MGNTSIIGVSSVSFSKNTTLRNELLTHFPNAYFNESRKVLSTEELIEFLKPANAALVGTEPINAEVLSHLPNLQMVSKYGVGLDNVDEAYLDAHQIALGWSGGVNRQSVAEQTLGMMIGLCRNLFSGSRQLRQGTWVKQGGVSLFGKTVGLVGFGWIGQEVWKLLQPFGCQVLVHDIEDVSDVIKSDSRAQQVSLSELLHSSDLVSLHVPLTPETQHLIDAHALSLMKPSSFLVNTSRGGVIDQLALQKALESNAIAGAALDVFEEEPITDQTFLALPNLVATPHIGGNSKEAVLAMGRSAIEHLQQFYAD